MPARVTDTANAAAAADRLIQELSTALAAPPSGSETTSNTTSALQNVQKHARSFGFSSKQCDQLVRLALIGRLGPLPSTGTSRSTRLKPPKSSVSLAILRSVVPKPRARVGRQAVLDIIASLGPSPGTDTVKVAGLRDDDRPTAGQVWDRKGSRWIARCKWPRSSCSLCFSNRPRCPYQWRQTSTPRPKVQGEDRLVKGGSSEISENRNECKDTQRSTQG